MHRGQLHRADVDEAERLQTLVRAGVVERWEDGNRVTYRLTESGMELEPIVQALGR